MKKKCLFITFLLLVAGSIFIFILCSMLFIPNAKAQEQIVVYQENAQRFTENIENLNNITFSGGNTTTVN